MNNANVNFHIHHVTRIEGHGDIVVNVQDGKIEECKWNVVEAPRFFEAAIKGRHYAEVPMVVSRICGICSVGHTLASVQAVEAAMGLEISPQARLHRRILIQGENLQSHVLHTYFLAAPDFVGAPSVFPLIPTHPDIVTRALRMKRLANDLCDVFGGRTVHPTTPTPGGFYAWPKLEAVKRIRQRFEEALPDVEATVALFGSLADRIPAFTRPTEYVALTRPDEYALYDGMIATTEIEAPVPITEYRAVTNEFIVPNSTAKYTRHKRDSFMVGALARFNLNAAQLSPLAKQAAARLGLTPICYNPFMNTVAQVVEIAHAVEEVIRLTDQVIAEGIVDERLSVKTRAGTGVGAVDVPRGILFHEYTFNDAGICQGGNIIIPTNENHNNLQRDMEAFLPGLLDLPQDKIALNLEMLVRAYDPCVSCSTHFLKVRFK